ncbi:MAG: hypothetical protein M3345_00025 [Actinomycetota bacterium]|nr:hypothetical protein [Actinomycetota bacterium]
MNKNELKKYAQANGFEDTTELAAAILYKAAEAQDLEDELAETKRQLDLAVLRAQRAKSELADVRKSAKDERSDEDAFDALINDILRATGKAVEEGRAKLDGRRAGVMWRLN